MPVVLAKACLLGVAVTSLLTVVAWPSEDAGEPIACHDLITPSVWHDGAFFYNVSMMKTGNPGGSS